MPNPKPIPAMPETYNYTIAQHFHNIATGCYLAFTQSQAIAQSAEPNEQPRIHAEAQVLWTYACINIMSALEITTTETTAAHAAIFVSLAQALIKNPPSDADNPSVVPITAQIKQMIEAINYSHGVGLPTHQPDTPRTP